METPTNPGATLYRSFPMLIKTSCSKALIRRHEGATTDTEQNVDVNEAVVSYLANG